MSLPLPERDDELHELVDHPDPYAAMRRAVEGRRLKFPSGILAGSAVKPSQNTPTQAVGASYGKAQEAADLARLAAIEESLVEPCFAVDELLDQATHAARLHPVGAVT